MFCCCSGGGEGGGGGSAEVAVKLLRATPGAIIYADVAGRNVPVFRNVYSGDALKREDAYQKLMAMGQHLERHGFGVLKVRPGTWPIFVKHPWGSMSKEAQNTACKWAIPLHFFHGFLEDSVMTLAMRRGIPAQPDDGLRRQRSASSQPLRGAVGISSQSKPDQPSEEGASASYQRGRVPDQASKADDVKGMYKEVDRGTLEEEEIPRNIPAATRAARRLCLKAKPASNVTFTTKRLVSEAGQSAYKLWGTCGNCQPKCNFGARVTLCIDGMGEGKFTVSHRGEHEQQKLAQGGRLLSAEVQNIVNDVIEAKAPITTKSLREAAARANVEFGCEPEQLYNLVRRLRQKNKQTSHVAPVASQVFLDEVKAWEAALPTDLDNAEDLSRLIVLKSPHGTIVEEGRVYVPMSCPGMLLRLRDAANHRIRLIVDMKMGAVANNYGVITLCFASNSERLRNTSAAMVQGRRQTYLAHTCTAQPVMQAIVHTEREDNVTACFEDLRWLCQQVGGFDLTAQLLHVHADFAPGIAAARRNVFPGVRLIGDYFHYKKALFKKLPSKFPKAPQGSVKAKGRKRRDPNVAVVSELSDLTRWRGDLQTRSIRSVQHVEGPLGSRRRRRAPV